MGRRPSNPDAVAIAAALQRAITANEGKPVAFSAVVAQLRASGAPAGRFPLLAELVLGDLVDDPSTTVFAMVRPGDRGPRYGARTPASR